MNIPEVYYDTDAEGNHYERWVLNNKTHRVDGPAIISHRPNGDVLTVEWKINGEYHRTDGPAFVFHYKCGNDLYGYLERWYINGRFHRVDGPAVIEANIKVTSDSLPQYKLYRNYHSISGSTSDAIIKYDSGNHTTCNRWFVDDIDVTIRVYEWMMDNNIPLDHTIWTDDHKLLFKLIWS